MYQIEIYENYSASDYYDAVILFPDKASEAVYYLLKHRLARALGRVFELHGFGLDDHYEDTIDDFFLYLYDHGDARPFAVIDTVREKQAFFGWIVGAYRHFLLNKAKEEMKVSDLDRKVSNLENEARKQEAAIMDYNRDIEEILKDIRNLEDIKKTLPSGCFNTPSIEKP